MLEKVREKNGIPAEGESVVDSTDTGYRQETKALTQERTVSETKTQTEKAHKKITLVLDKSIEPKLLASKELNLQILRKLHLYLRNVTAPL